MTTLASGDRDAPRLEALTLAVSHQVDETLWDAQLELYGGPFFHCSAWARYRCHDGGSPLFLRWQLDGQPEPAAFAVGIQKPGTASPVGRIASRLHFNSSPAAKGSFEFVEPLRRWAAVAPGIVSVTLGTLDARAPWAGSDLPGAVRRHEFLVDRQSGRSFLQNMREMTRRSVARARKRGIEVRQTVEPADLLAFARLHEENSARLRRTKHVRLDQTDPELTAESLTILTTPGRARLYLAEEDGKPLAGCLFGCFADSAYYLQAGAVDRAREVGAVPLTLLEAFEDLTSRGFHRINLGGIDAGAATDPTHVDHGLYAFKLGLGTRPVESVAGTLRVKPLRCRGVDLALKILRR